MPAWPTDWLFNWQVTGLNLLTNNMNCFWKIELLLKVSRHWATSCRTCRGDPSQWQIGLCVLKNFCKSLCLLNRILLQQHVAKNQIRQNLCDLLWWHAETKIFTKILKYTQSDLSLRRVTTTCRCNYKLYSPNLHTQSDMSPQLVAATCLKSLIDKLIHV